MCSRLLACGGVLVVTATVCMAGPIGGLATVPASQPAAPRPSQLVRTENWPGYEGGNLHHNASATDINLAKAAVLWEARFDHPVDCKTTNPGFFGSRNLAFLDGRIAVVAANGREGFEKGTAYVSILSAADGRVLNCISTTQTTGPRRNQMKYPTGNYMEAYDTGIGITVMDWDPATGVLFLRNGGDNPGNTAYLPLANAASYKGGSQKGVGVYEEFLKTYPNFQDADGNVRRDKEIPCDEKRFLDGDQWDYGTLKPKFNNQPNSTGFFEVDTQSGLMAAAIEGSHRQSGGYFLLEKHTGLYSKVSKGKIEEGKQVFAKWGGIRVGNGRVYFMGPCDDTAGDGYNSSLFKAELPDQGLAIYSYKVSWQDRHDNVSYNGPGTAETAELAPVFSYQFHSSHKPTSPEDAESYLELDAFHRNKTWLIDGTGVWAAWKKDRLGNLQLIHCDDERSDTYDLGIGAGQRGQDIWGHMSLADIAGRKYIVYYAGNGLYRKYESMKSSSRGEMSLANWSPQTDKPLGPAAIAVFDIAAGKTAWTCTLNAADGSGPYASLPANEAEGYFDRSAMVVAGGYAVVAWVDAAGEGNAALHVLSFDITAKDKPKPAEFTCDLGIPKAANRQTCVFDLIAVRGTLYALVTDSNTLNSGHHTWTGQRVIAIGTPKAR